MSPLQSKALRILSCCIASSALAYDVYVAKDGNDNNSGLTRAEAKATIAAGYAVLEGNAAATVGARLILGDGEWTSTDFGSTLVLSNGWSLVGEHGRDGTILKTLAADFKFFNLATADVAVRGLTFDYGRGSVSYTAPVIDMTNGGTLDSCEFKNFYAKSGGKMIESEETAARISITNCVFSNCKTLKTYALVYFLKTSNTANLITHCKFMDCAAGDSGNSSIGIVYFARGKGTVRNCLFVRCGIGKAESGYGYGSVVACGATSSAITVENCTFTGCNIVNSTAAGMAGNRSGGGSITIHNCLAFGNTNGNGPVGFVTTRGSLSYSASEIETAGTGNIVLTDGNFRFRRPSAGDYTVKFGPTINAGNNYAWMTDATDLAGRPRIIGGKVDMGCYEADPVNATRVMVQ